MSETPIRYPDPPDRDDEQTAPLPPFESPPDQAEEEQSERGDEDTV